MEAYNLIDSFKSPTEPVGYAYCDDSPALKKALDMQRIRYDTSTPGQPKTNGIAERQVQEVINGTRVLLSKAGLPASFWPYAMRAWCFGHNTETVGKNPSPYKLRHGADFMGPKIPFGSLVYFKQSPVKEGNKAKMGSRRLKSKFAGDSNTCICLGYKLKCGGKWKHEYLVCDLRDLATQDFGRGARNTTKAMHIQTVRNISLNMFRCFPCRPEYDKANQTLEGIQRSIATYKTVDGKLVDTTSHSFLHRKFPRDKEFEARMDDVELDDDTRERLLEESNRPEDEGSSHARLDASEEHALVETRQEEDSTDNKEDDEEMIVMAPQDCLEQSTIGPESRQLTISEYRDVAFKGPTETIIDDHSGEVYDIKRNPIHPDILSRVLEDPNEEYQRAMDWNEIDKSITGTFDENEVFNFTQDRVVSDENPWTIPHHWARKVGGDGRWYPRDRHGARIVKIEEPSKRPKPMCPQRIGTEQVTRNAIKWS